MIFDETKESATTQAPLEESSATSNELAHIKEQLAYLRSDFENFRRRTEKERLQWVDFGKESVLKQFLPVVDDVERALADLKAHDLPEELKSRLAGLELIHKSLLKTLAQLQVTEIPYSEVFNPELHEGVMYVSAEGKESGTVVAVLEKGYKHKDAVLRPAKVSVAQ